MKTVNPHINKVNPHIFRGYDLRGIVPDDLNEKTVRLIMKGFVTMLFEKQIKEVVVGRDNRNSSEEIEKYVIDELLKNGVDVYSIGKSLSQIVYWSQYHFLSKACIMVTASHNPKDYNGFKLGRSFSDTLESEEIKKLRSYVEKGNFKKYDRQAQFVKKDIFEDYKNDLLKRVTIDKKFKVVVEGSNTYSGEFVSQILEDTGCSVIRQNCEPNGNFPLGTPDPTENDVLERLSKRVLKEKADLGFTYDADGDRVGIVDDKGQSIWNDNLVSIFAQDVLYYEPGGTIVYNTLCSKQTADVIRSSGGNPLMWLTGHSFIKAKLKQEKAAFGGELSGHMFFVDNFYGHDDGAFASLRLLQYLSRTNQTLSETVAKMPKYVSSPEIKFGCADEIKFDFIKTKITKEFKNLFGKTASYIDIDGIRADTKDEMVIIRASQNGPYLTVKFEGKTQKKYNDLKKKIKAILKKYKEVDFSSGVNKDALD
ncbi:hypothetical protein A2X44_00495 [candidate division CPR3 bacterium GWF2_35_18]|uniref:Phosphomannomutase n=1 Tax=candidate division CPR3 bacterium GW2011_GWF2_35_18 TaxID=1618350 RepID=A0A0G0BL85_UNCC3|nr:MAG: Phosphomannomutase [candidate division CPR3 bacterium GW2011_GWF2_35_18]OGB63393.1 MAG: hypothetical protein A2X44_00495 [candidate division CPR3 bacterium GWF2_35_18]OGB64862.1 MAG: hypothetical protein A2250_05535 [candidate division CPR3 bacterium RIFOXYA2_FULL_35_13]OGB75647.1 MAG: hypothetical protein A2476_03890 [candidate division CPR3 bacterium RIFOXYC2_FULL_35_7]OGB78981.1 MAG: hypothetical protein A2296_04640 [candidate division CPR3 bacterium RIFOXYB2_FULL_35_8]